MGKSLKGKELGVGISQRQDGLYQARFTNRFGQRETLYDKNLNNLRVRMRKAQTDDDNAVNVVRKDMTLDEWYGIWITTCKGNCRNSSAIQYSRIYKSVKSELGWRKLQSITPITLQKTLNGLKSDHHRRDVKMVLSNMLGKALENDMITKNPAKHLVTRIHDEAQKERRVLTIKETGLFMEYAKECRYHDLFVVALETGMRIGELGGLYWSDVDFKKNAIFVNRTMCYIQGENGYYFETHSPKTACGKRLIPMTSKCAEALTRQKLNQLSSNTFADGEFSDLVFTTNRKRPLQEMSVITSINIILKNMAKDGIVIKKFRPHTFRHTFATRAIENGMNPKTLQKILGHSTLQMTMDLYCHVTDDTLFNEMKKMEK